jgi:peptidoglycan/LPS O-acetylase OafA/YrhL
MTSSSLSRTAVSFIHLDAVRAAAAFLVFISHLRGFVFLPYGKLAHHSPLDMAVWSITGIGHQAVMIFFVLSGFFITRSVLEDESRGGFHLRTYLTKRLTRLWIVLLPCLVLTLVWDGLAIHLAGPAFYDGHLAGIYDTAPQLQSGGADLGLRAFLGNVFFVQTILVPTFGSNGPFGA